MLWPNCANWEKNPISETIISRNPSCSVETSIIALNSRKCGTFTCTPPSGWSGILSSSMIVYEFSHCESGAMIGPGMISFETSERRIFLFHRIIFFFRILAVYTSYQFHFFLFLFINILLTYWKLLQVIYPFTVSSEDGSFSHWLCQLMEIYLIVIHCNRSPMFGGCFQVGKL